MPGSSINGDRHPYMRGHKFWSTAGAFWRNNNLYSEKTKKELDQWLENMRQKETNFIRL